MKPDPETGLGKAEAPNSCINATFVSPSPPGTPHPEGQPNASGLSRRRQHGSPHGRQTARRRPHPDRLRHPRLRHATLARTPGQKSDLPKRPRRSVRDRLRLSPHAGCFSRRRLRTRWPGQRLNHETPCQHLHHRRSVREGDRAGDGSPGRHCCRLPDLRRPAGRPSRHLIRHGLRRSRRCGTRTADDFVVGPHIDRCRRQTRRRAGAEANQQHSLRRRSRCHSRGVRHGRQRRARPRGDDRCRQCRQRTQQRHRSKVPRFRADPQFRLRCRNAHPHERHRPRHRPGRGTGRADVGVRGRAPGLQTRHAQRRVKARPDRHRAIHRTRRRRLRDPEKHGETSKHRTFVVSLPQRSQVTRKLPNCQGQFVSTGSGNSEPRSRRGVQLLYSPTTSPRYGPEISSTREWSS